MIIVRRVTGIRILETVVQFFLRISTQNLVVFGASRFALVRCCIEMAVKLQIHITIARVRKPILRYFD